MGKCRTCDGTGYDSAQRRAGMMNCNLPFNMIPLGVWQCESCGGTGKEWEMPKIDFTSEENSRLRNHLKRVMAQIERKKKKCDSTGTPKKS